MPKKSFGDRIIAARNQIAPNGPDELKAFKPHFTSPFIRKYFGAFHLDPEDRDDRDRLLAIFFIATLGTSEPGRRPTKRDFNQLIYDVEAARNGRKKSDREICRVLIEDSRGRFEGRYKDYSERPNALRHRVRELRELLGGNWDTIFVNDLLGGN